MSKLVAVFSYSGVTKRAAERIAKENGASIFEIKATVPYTSADVNWQDESSRNVKEYKDASSRPEIAELPDMIGVDEIWIGYPIWWYTHPRIINTFFDQVKMDGIKIHLFATSSVTGIDGSLKELRETYPGLDIADAKRVPLLKRAEVQKIRKADKERAMYYNLSSDGHLWADPATYDYCFNTDKNELSALATLISRIVLAAW